jgi:CBS domain-containing protein
VKISDILRYKGTAVVTIAPTESVRDLLARLAEHNVGALVVADGEQDPQVIGIISERDIARHLNDRGAEILDLPVSELMTASVVSCSPNDDVDSIAGGMTELRIRHMPVLSDGKLAGIVTIGDVVAGRIRQLEQDRGQLEQYITQGR